MKTRKEQIWDEACHRYADSKMRNAFVAAANWADSHPAWVSVKDSLPEDDECYIIYGDCGIDFGSYNSKTQYWLSDYSGQPTHWMPMPVPPQRKEE